MLEVENQSAQGTGFVDNPCSRGYASHRDRQSTANDMEDEEMSDEEKKVDAEEQNQQDQDPHFLRLKSGRVSCGILCICSQSQIPYVITATPGSNVM